MTLPNRKDIRERDLRVVFDLKRWYNRQVIGIPLLCITPMGLVIHIILQFVLFTEDSSLLVQWVFRLGFLPLWLSIILGVFLVTSGWPELKRRPHDFVQMIRWLSVIWWFCLGLPILSTWLAGLMGMKGGGDSVFWA